MRYNVEEAAYRMGQLQALEKTANMAVLKGVFDAGRAALSSRAGTLFTQAQKYAPKLIGDGTRAANIARTVGNDLLSGQVITSGLLNAGMTAYQGGDWGDIAKSYAVGSLGFGLGSKYLGLAGNRMAAKYIKNPMGTKQLGRALVGKGVSPSQAYSIGKYNNQAITALKAGNLKDYEKYNKLYNDILGKTDVVKGNFITSPIRKLMFNAGNNRANIGIGLAGTAASLYFGSKLNDQLSSAAGVSGTQIAEKQMLKQQKEQAKMQNKMLNQQGQRANNNNMQNPAVPPQPMRGNTLMYGNNPYSYG